MRNVQPWGHLVQPRILMGLFNPKLRVDGRVVRRRFTGTEDCGNRRYEVGRGDLMALLSVGDDGPRGMIGLAEVLSSPYEDEHFAEDGKLTNYVDVAFMDPICLGRPLPFGDLVAAGLLPPRGLRQGNLLLSTAETAVLLSMWSAHIA